MAIAYDATSRGTGTASHTCSGSERILIVSAVSQSGTSVPTYNGVSMTSLTSQTTAHHKHEVFYLIAPATGANNIVCTGGTWVATSYTGVSQVAPIDSSNSGQTASYTINVATTVVASNCWIVSATGASFNSNSYTSNSNRTDRFTSTVIQPATPYMNTSIGDSNGTVGTGSQSTTHSQTGGAGTGYSIVGIDLSLSPFVIIDYPVTIAQGSFTFTGYDAVISKGVQYALSLAHTTFSYTGYILSFILDLYTRVVNKARNSVSVVNKTRSAVATVTNKARNVVSVINKTRN